MCSSDLVHGTSGGTSSVSSGTQSITTISATGGGYGQGYTALPNNQVPGAGGTTSGGVLFINGQTAWASGGGGTPFGWFNNGSPAGYGVGGAGFGYNPGPYFGVGGGGGGYVVGYLSALTPGNTLTVTVGAAGSAGSSGSPGNQGFVLIEW